MTPTCIGIYAVTVLRMTPCSTISIMAKVSMVPMFTFTFHWLIAIAISPVTTWKRQAIGAIRTRITRVANAFSGRIAVSMYTTWFADRFAAQHSSPTSFTLTFEGQFTVSVYTTWQTYALRTVRTHPSYFTCTNVRSCTVSTACHTLIRTLWNAAKFMFITPAR